MPTIDPHTLDLLRLTCTPGFGPVLIARAISTLGGTDAVLGASSRTLQNVRGIGPGKAEAIARGRDRSQQAAEAEVILADRLGVRIMNLSDADYPPLLRSINDPPPLLYVRGGFEPEGSDKYPVAIVGSRKCSAYGIEQTERFSAAFASAKLTVVSGGARGIDTAAHRAALRVGGRTVAVLGCGLAQCYPPDNKPLFDAVADGRGAVLSELPLNTSPSPENFPARNRIISGASLGVLVAEAGARSGALITARLAVEDHSREVFAIPGRVDAPASQGTLELIKSSGAALVTCPADVIEALEAPARHLFEQTYEHLYAPQDARSSAEAVEPKAGMMTDHGLSETQRRILADLDQPSTIDTIATSTGLMPEQVRAELTVLELRRLVLRNGSRITRLG